MFMDTKSPYEEINVEYKGRQFKIYVYKHLHFIKASTIFLIKTSPVIERHIQADEVYNDTDNDPGQITKLVFKTIL
jgi:hypothetical protein